MRQLCILLCVGVAAANTAAATRIASPLTAAESAPAGPVTTLALDVAVLDTLRQAERFTFTGFPLDAATTVDLELRRFEVLTPDAVIVVHTDDGDVIAPRPDVVMLRGSVAGRPGSRVFLSLSPHGANGFVRTDGEQYIVAGAKGDGRPTVIYNLDRLPAGALDITPFECGTDDLEPVRRFEAAPAAGASVAYAGPTCGTDASVAVETDWEFTESFGGNTSVAETYALSLMGAVASIYVTEDPDDIEVGVGVAVSHLSLWSTQDDPWTETNTQAQLVQFRDYWQANNISIERNVAHFLSTRVMSGAGGLGYLPGLCQGELAYAISTRLEGDFPQPLEFDGHSQNWDLVVVAHELGHNFGAPHTHVMEPPVDECAYGICDVDPDTGMIEGTIMSYCHQCNDDVANVNLVFHERTINEWIHPYLASGLPCEMGSEPPTISSQPSSVVLCKGETAIFTVLIGPGDPVTYQWRFNGIDITGADTPAYVIAAVDHTDVGVYTVVVSTECASVESDTALLTIDPRCPPDGGTCLADVDDDGIVGITDLLILLGAWGTDPFGAPDFDGDGNVGINDMLFLLGFWGPCE